MPSFFLTASSQTARTLGPGETGVVADTATLFTTASAAVTMDGSARLSVFGTMATEAVEALRILDTSADVSVTVGAQGSILGILDAAIRGSLTDQFHLNNAGLIQGIEEAIAVTAVQESGFVADFHVVNAGRILSNGDFTTESTVEITQYAGATVNIANAGEIVNGGLGGAIQVVLGRLDLTNSGIIQTRTVAGAIVADASNDTVDNTGTIIGRVALGDGNDTLTNHGSISGSVSLGSGSDVVVNTGTINGPVNVGDATSSGAIADSVTNAGTIIGDVVLGSGNDTFRSDGGHVSGTVFGGTGDDTYFIDRPDIALSDSGGFDSVHSTADCALTLGLEQLFLQGGRGLRGVGSVGANTITGGAGDDTILGGEGNDSLSGVLGDDRMLGGLGNDTILAFDDDDFARGGAGDDLVQVVFGDATLDGGQGNDTLSVAFVGLAPVAVNLAAGTGGGEALGSWTLSRFENATGGSGDDTLTGSDGDNLLQGGEGGDSLSGGGGNDTMTGGAGSDTMLGGLGEDVFVYAALPDSGPDAADLLVGFSRARDVIDLSAIQAVAGDPAAAFVFRGDGAFTGGAAGEVRFTADAGSGLTTIEVRLGGSTANDMVILLSGAITLTAGNFLL
jgi:hypothetical protein